MAADSGSARKKSKTVFITGIVTVVAVAFLAAGIGAGAVNSVRRREEAKRQEPVMKVGDMTVSRALFELFCINVIEGDGFEELKNQTASISTLAAAVKARAADDARKYAAIRSEAEKSGVKLSPMETSTDDLYYAPSGSNVTGYTYKYFGLSEEEYRDLCLGWKLCEKYINGAVEDSEYDDSFLRFVFEKNPDSLAYIEGDGIRFALLASDEGASELKRASAGKICDAVNAAADDEKDAVFAGFYADYNEPRSEGDTVNTVLSADYFAENYPSLLYASEGDVAGRCFIFDSGNEIIVLRVKKLRTYEYYRNSDELKNLAKQEVRRNVISGILENEKYIGETYPALDSVDITKYLRTDKS
ncbi:MAG: hypothetical protein J6X47_00730 [Clostridia bacterium]|nr:hypothetical protein [Clostridia bacterium]